MKTKLHFIRSLYCVQVTSMRSLYMNDKSLSNVKCRKSYLEMQAKPIQTQSIKSSGFRKKAIDFRPFLIKS